MILEKDKWYFVEFMDHSLGSKALEAIRCQIVGKFISEDKYQYSFAYWENMHPDFQEENREYINIVKGTIIRKKKMPI